MNKMGVLKTIHNRKRTPTPFSDCDPLPWNDPEISKGLLEVHLSQGTDQASRRYEKIIEESVFLENCFRSFAGEGARILDLACGPGFYAAELAKMGHKVTGVDFSPAAIEYADKKLKESRLPIEYHLADLRKVELPAEFYDGCYYIYSMPNALTKDELFSVAKRIFNWLKPGGIYISELLTIEGLKNDTEKDWDTYEKSALSQKPHLWLDEKIWNEKKQSQVYRIYVVDIATGAVSEYCESHQGYSIKDYVAVLESAGFTIRNVFSGLSHEDYTDESDWAAFVAQKI